MSLLICKMDIKFISSQIQNTTMESGSKSLFFEHVAFATVSKTVTNSLRQVLKEGFALNSIKSARQYFWQIELFIDFVNLKQHLTFNKRLKGESWRQLSPSIQEF